MQWNCLSSYRQVKNSSASLEHLNHSLLCVYTLQNCEHWNSSKMLKYHIFFSCVYRYPIARDSIGILKVTNEVTSFFSTAHHSHCVLRTVISLSLFIETSWLFHQPKVFYIARRKLDKGLPSTIPNLTKENPEKKEKKIKSTSANLYKISNLNHFPSSSTIKDSKD